MWRLRAWALAGMISAPLLIVAHGNTDVQAVWLAPQGDGKVPMVVHTPAPAEKEVAGGLFARDNTSTATMAMSPRQLHTAHSLRARASGFVGASASGAGDDDSNDPPKKPLPPSRTPEARAKRYQENKKKHPDRKPSPSQTPEARRLKREKEPKPSDVARYRREKYQYEQDALTGAALLPPDPANPRLGRPRLQSTPGEAPRYTPRPQPEGASGSSFGPGNTPRYQPQTRPWPEFTQPPRAPPSQPFQAPWTPLSGAVPSTPASAYAGLLDSPPPSPPHQPGGSRSPSPDVDTYLNLPPSP